MLRDIAPISNNGLAIEDNQALHVLGQAANQAASHALFSDYRERRAANTIRLQDTALALFAEYLEVLRERAEIGFAIGDLAHDPEAWRGISWGLVTGFLRWQLGQGYAIATVNVRLSTVKTYSKLAFKARVLAAEEYALIKAVEGYSRKEAKRINERREDAGIDTRTGHKKEHAVSIKPNQAKGLKTHRNTPQGRRDALLLCLMLDHGLRVSEVAILERDNFNLDTGALRFYRPKVDLWQTHTMTDDTWQAAQTYIMQDAPEAGVIWRRSTRTGVLGDALSSKTATRSITKRVEYLGRSVELYGLSAHDCRHYWATQAAKHNTPIERLKEAGGWSSLAMPARYIEAAKIANEGVKLGG